MRSKNKTVLLWTLQGLNIYEKGIFWDFKKNLLFVHVRLRTRGIILTLQGCAPVGSIPFIPLQSAQGPSTCIELKSSLIWVTSRADLLCSVGWLVLVLQSHRQDACHWQNSYLALHPSGPHDHGCLTIGWKDGPSTETVKINKKRGRNHLYRQGSRKKGGENNTSLAVQLGS